MKTSTALILACLLTPTFAMAKPVDWTNYLAGFKAGCETPDLDKAIPANLKPSIVKTINQRKLDDGTYVGKKVITLKNATAFGYPLTKVVLDSNGYQGDTSLYFANSDFMKLRNQFYITTPQGKLYASQKRTVPDPDSFEGEIKADGNGYSTGLEALIFDAKTNRITCGWSAP